MGMENFGIGIKNPLNIKNPRRQNPTAGADFLRDYARHAAASPEVLAHPGRQIYAGQRTAPGRMLPGKE